MRDVDGSVSWTYDDDFRVATQSVNGGSTVGFSYDDDGARVAAGSATLTRDPTSARITAVTLGDVDTAFDYSDFGELTD